MPPHARSRAVLTALLVALCGVITGAAAAGHVGPFSPMGGTAQRTVAAQLPGAPLRADELYPAPTSQSAVHQIIVVTDPPIVADPRAATDTPRPTSDDSTPEPEPTSTPSPTATPCDDDCGSGGGGDDGGGGGGD
jgi:hypothetical protein